MSDVSKINISSLETSKKPYNSIFSDYSKNHSNSHVSKIDKSTIDNFDTNSKVDSILNETMELWDDTKQNVGDILEKVCSDISNDAKSLWTDATNWWDDVEAWWNFDALPVIENATSAVWDVIKSVEATKVVFYQSLVEGILQFGEAIVDFTELVGTAVFSVGTGLVDGGQAIYSLITGEEWSSVTKEMWEETMGFVSKQYVTGWFDSLYENTKYGQWLKDNAYGFDTVRSIGSGIGYTAGIVILTIATAGLGGAAATGGSVTTTTAVSTASTTQMSFIAASAGIGKGTQNAWNDGADLLEGLTNGTLSGLWEGLQFYIGGKISNLKIFESDGTGTKVLNALSRVILDGVDGGAEGFVLPLLSSIYKDGYYDENGTYIEFSDDKNILERYSEIFDDNGGWSTVLTQASIGSALSLISEGFDLRKYFKSSDGLDSSVTNEIKIQKSLIEQINEVNYHTQKGDLLNYTFKINSIDEITPDLISKIYDPSIVSFKIGDKVFDYIDIKKQIGLINDIGNNTIDFDAILSEDISPLLKKADISDYNLAMDFNTLYQIMHNNFDNIIGHSKVDEVLYSINVIDVNNWQQLLYNRNLPSTTLGFVDKNQNLFLPSNASMHTAIHELLHKLSDWRGKYVYDAYGNIKRVTGLRTFFSDGSNTNIANEKITDFLASKIFDEKIYNSVYGDVHLNLIDRFNDLLTYAYKDSTVLSSSYIMNDSSILEDFFSKFSTQATYWQFMVALDNPEYLYTDYLNNVISELENKFYPKKGNFIDSILSIFKKQRNHEYGIVSNTQQVLKKVCDPMSSYNNLDSAVSWFFQNDGFNTDPYNIFVTSIGKGSKKSKPSISQVKNFLNRFNILNGYHVENQGHYFTHVFSSDNYLQNIDLLQHRLYLNTDHNDAYKFVQIFADKCENKGIPFYFKVAYFEDMDMIKEFSLMRDESIVVYAEDKFLPEYVNICNEIKKENPNLYFNQPPIFTGIIDGFIGYGGESKNHSTSYNRIRSDIMTKAITSVTNRFMEVNPNFNFFEIKKDWNTYSKFLDSIYEYIKRYSTSMGIDYNNFAFTID